MKFFPSSEHIFSWAELSPGNNESARKRNTYLANWYWRLKSKKGTKRATIDLARKILIVIFNMLKNLVPYDDSTYENLRLKCEKRKANSFISELTRLVYQVVSLN